MKKTGNLIWIVGICLVFAVAARAQESTANPVTASAKEIYDRQSDRIVASAEEMPGDKYSYHPTPDQWTFGKIVAHVAQSDFAVCTMISDTPAPAGFDVAETDAKEKLVPALKASFDFCSKAVAKLQDSQMGDTITFFRGRKTPRSRAVIELVSDLVDHYSQMASYLRLNGMVPPSAQPPKPAK
jgi:uncharacterized damage-inducible protein DinB